MTVARRRIHDGIPGPQPRREQRVRPAHRRWQCFGEARCRATSVLMSSGSVIGAHIHVGLGRFVIQKMFHQHPREERRAQHALGAETVEHANARMRRMRAEHELAMLDDRPDRRPGPR